MLFFSKLLNLWRETFPARPHKLMSIEYIGAIEEFNEYFPGFAEPSETNYKLLRKYYRNMSASFGCMPLRNSFAEAMKLDDSIEEWLHQNPEKRRHGLRGEWAVDIFSDHNDKVMEKYRKYKAARLQKLYNAKLDLEKREQQLRSHNDFELQWQVGHNEFTKHIAEIRREARDRMSREAIEADLAKVRNWTQNTF